MDLGVVHSNVAGANVSATDACRATELHVAKNRGVNMVLTRTHAQAAVWAHVFCLGGILNCPFEDWHSIEEKGQMKA